MMNPALIKGYRKFLGLFGMQTEWQVSKPLLFSKFGREKQKSRAIFDPAFYAKFHNLLDFCSIVSLIWIGGKRNLIS